MHTYIHICIHTYMHICIHTYIHAYIHTYIHTHTHTHTLFSTVTAMHGGPVKVSSNMHFQSIHTLESERVFTLTEHSRHISINCSIGKHLNNESSKICGLSYIPSVTIYSLENGNKLTADTNYYAVRCHIYSMNM